MSYTSPLIIVIEAIMLRSIMAKKPNGKAARGTIPVK